MDKETRKMVVDGYRRIAFGDVSGPVRLLFCEEATPRLLRGMDLFNIAEIKRLKGGGMEIKFFDRIRAMQCLQEVGEEEESAYGFYKALERGAEALENGNRQSGKEE